MIVLHVMNDILDLHVFFEIKMPKSFSVNIPRFGHFSSWQKGFCDVDCRVRLLRRILTYQKRSDLDFHWPVPKSASVDPGGQSTIVIGSFQNLSGAERAVVAKIRNQLHHPLLVVSVHAC